MISSNLERDAINQKKQDSFKFVKSKHMTDIDTSIIFHNKTFNRSIKNLEIYIRIVFEKRKVIYQYYIMFLIINVFFMNQIIVAAILIAFDVFNDFRFAITILDSINIIIAEIQIYFKRQDLSNRIKQYQFDLRKLRNMSKIEKEISATKIVH